MIIKKILNNNAIVSENSNGKDFVAFGRGIAFKKKSGDFIDDSLVNQVFELKSEQNNLRFQEIVTNIPLEYIELANNIIDMIKIELGQKINDTIYVTLSDHMFNAIERFKEGIKIRNTMLWEIQHYYENEYSLAKKSLSIIKESINIDLPDDEAGFIALHIINAETEDSEIEETLEVTAIIQKIAKIVRYHFSIELDTESVYFFRFITHLKFFAQRLVYNKIIDGSADKELLEIVKDKYNDSYQCVEKITQMIQENYNYRISDEEKMYLTIHIHRITEANKGNN